MILNTKGYAYNDVTIIPAKISNITSRSECNPYIKNTELPIFTAPMASVVDDVNYQMFINYGITSIIPRNIDLNKRIEIMNKGFWIALSLREFEDLFIIHYKDRIDECCNHYRICVDIANGHMKSLYDKCLSAKIHANYNKYGLTIMTGNIANPETYIWICNLNDTSNIKVIDYIRCGIGSGAGCITSSNTSIHYPMASLIDECYQIYKHYKNYTSKDICPEIIADGGIRNYSDVIKALALGANYVMIGGLFSQCIESAGDKYSMNQLNKIDMRFNYNAWVEDSLRINENGEWFGHIKELKDEKYIGKLNVKFFGMASADGQKSISGRKTKTAEGITKMLPVKYKLSSWIENMTSYLRSAMSYTNCKTLNDFIGKQTLIPNSISEIQSVNK